MAQPSLLRQFITGDSTRIWELLNEVRDYLNAALGRVPYAMATGSVTLPTAAAVSTQIDVTFPAGRFTATPIIGVSLLGSPGGSQNYVPRVVARSTTTATIGVWNTTGNITVAPTVMWIAAQE